MAISIGFKPYVLNAYAALVGEKPGNTALSDHVAFISNTGIGVAGYKAALEGYFATTSSAALATALLTNMGLTGIFTQEQAEAFLAANPGNRVGAIIDLSMQLYSYNGTDAQLLTAKAAYASAIDASGVYSNNAANPNGESLTITSGQSFALTAGFDSLIGGAFDDVFTARTIGNANTLNDGDKIDGGAGKDTLYVDFTSLGNAITPRLTSIESVVIRAQTTTTDATNGNNTSGAPLVQIDAQRSLAVDAADHVTAATGVSRWESNNSRSDVVIEDVRIGNSQKTKDVTIAMVETDPGNVDFAVYFDQFSLRNAGGGTSTLVIQIMDTGAAAAIATSATPLLNNPYDTFKIGINGALQSISLNSAATPTAAADADTYAQLLSAFQAALTAAGADATVALGADFTVIDPLSGKSVTGKSLVLTGGAGISFSDTTPGAGWFNTTGAAVPNSSNIYTTFTSGSTTISELVTSTVVLDDVGRGSTGGDLVIGGQSTGDTSTSRGVERFEITVEDNSKLQTINSTNNALREVTIVNGKTTNAVVDAYTTTVVDAGNLTVNGNAAQAGSGPANGNNSLPGVENNSAVGVHDGAFGFTDVRLIDGSAMRGKLAFDAQITSDSIAKYITQVDTAANPYADVAGTGNINFNVPGANFVYTGGLNNDTIAVTVDTAAVSSRSSVVTGLSDFTFNLDGGAGNDAITLTVAGAGLAGGAQAWYNNQKLNANIFINGGAGDDTVKTPGAGDAIIDLGDGNDTVYTDNTGALVIPVANGAATSAATAYADAAAAELAAGLAANVASNATGFVRVSGTEAGGSAFVTTAAAANALNTLNLVTPVIYDVATAPTYAAVQTAIVAAVAAGGLSFTDANALASAYKTQTVAGVVTPAATLIDQVWTPGTAHAAGVISSTDFAAGNQALDVYIAAAKTAAATSSSADALVQNTAAYNADSAAVPAAPVAGELLNATQQAVVAATQAMNNVFDPVGVGSGITVTVTGYTEGVTPVAAGSETQLVTLVGNASGAVSFLGTAVATSAAADTAAQTATKIAADGAIIAAWNAIPANAAQQILSITQANAADAFVTVTFTAPMGDVANLAASAVSAGIVFGAGAQVIQGSLGVVGVTESFTATITGASAAGEVITVDGAPTAAFAGGESTTAIATAIAAAINNVAGSFSAASAINVITVTGTAALTAIAGTVGSGDFVSSVSLPVAAGTQTTVNNLAALSTALAVGATDAQVVTALQTAIDNGSITAGDAATIFGAVTGGSATMTAPELDAITLTMSQLQTIAANKNTAAQTTLTDALAADAAVVNAAARAASADPVLANAATIPTDATAAAAAADAFNALGSTEAATAAATAATNVKNWTTGTVTPLTTQSTNLDALKTAMAASTTDLQAWTATQNAVDNKSISAADKLAIDNAVGMVASVPLVAGTVTAAEKVVIAQLITALQLTNETLLADANKDLANLTAISTATSLASTVATAAANSGGAGTAEFTAAPKAVFVLNTSGQNAVYNLTTMDDRNLADLKSDANNSNNFFNSTVKVTYKGIDASVVVAGTGFKTTDLELNQAIKQAINSDAVLSKLVLATDGPANTLVVTSLIDGIHTTADLAVTVTMPTSAGANVAAAAAAYGLAAGSTDAQVIAVMTAAKASFDAKGDYVTQFAESGAAGGNASLVGANSVSSSDNTVTPGTGNDVIVLGTTETIVDKMTSSNEKVVYAGLFGNDTIVHFDASGNGIDTLDFTALNGRSSAFGSLTADKSIVVGAPVATALTAVQIAALFTDSATAINHVYVAVDSTNIGSIWQVADAAGADGRVATLVGSIDLADTSWASLTAANFV